MYSVECTVYSVEFTVYSVQCTVYNVQCTMYSVQCTVYNVHCTLYTGVHCTLYSVQCTVYTGVQCTVHSVLHSFTLPYLVKHAHRPQVATFAGVLSKHGVGKGDRVLIYMPMVPEAMVAMLASARLGAIHSLVFGGFASRQLASRINHAEVCGGNRWGCGGNRWGCGGN